MAPAGIWLLMPRLPAHAGTAISPKVGAWFEMVSRLAPNSVWNWVGLSVSQIVRSATEET